MTRNLFSFLSDQRTASICVSQDVRPLSISVVHIFTSYHFRENHLTSDTITRFLGQFLFDFDELKGPLDRRLLTSGFFKARQEV